jgi:hypothetical protein
MIKNNKKNRKITTAKMGMYKGPLHKKGDTFSGVDILINLHTIVSLASNALGVLAFEQTFNPNTTIEWARYAALFREFRVLGVSVSYKNSLHSNTTAIVGGSAVVSTNKGSAAGVPASRNAVYSGARSKIWDIMEPHYYEIRADDYTDLDMGGTSTPSSEFSLLWFSDGLTASTSYGFLYIEYLCQFSGPQ